jgi:hypothetical protein
MMDEYGIDRMGFCVLRIPIGDKSDVQFVLLKVAIHLMPITIIP